MRYQAIIFDMDGTIVETEHIWEYARNSLLISRGIPLTPELEQEIARRLAGTALRESCAIIKELTNIKEPVEQLMQEKMTVANASFENGIRYISGFLPFHTRVRAKNIATALATNASEQTVSITNKKLNLTQLFGEHIYNISHVHNVGKPHPAIYLYAAKQLGIDPQQCIAIEDSANGVQAAKGAGMMCIAINTSKKPERLQAADMIINSYDEIMLDAL